MYRVKNYAAIVAKCVIEEDLLEKPEMVAL